MSDTDCYEVPLVEQLESFPIDKGGWRIEESPHSHRSIPAGPLARRAATRIRELETEVLEQARLLGMSGEREADLLGKVDRLKAENAKLRTALEAWRTLDRGNSIPVQSERPTDMDLLRTLDIARRLTEEALK